MNANMDQAAVVCLVCPTNWDMQHPQHMRDYCENNMGLMERQLVGTETFMLLANGNGKN